MPDVTSLTKAAIRIPRGNFDLVVLAASAGGVEALGHVLGGLPADFALPVAVVQHTAAPSMLPQLLKLRTGLSVTWASEGARPRTVYVAPVDRRFSVTSQFRCSLDDSEKVNYVRPSADVLFCSAALACPGRVLGVVLTGYGRDGAAGAQAVKRAGGYVLAQDRSSSREFGMPGATIAAGAVDLVLPLASIAPAIISLATIPGIGVLFPTRRHSPPVAGVQNADPRAT